MDKMINNLDMANNLEANMDKEIDHIEAYFSNNPKCFLYHNQPNFYHKPKDDQEECVTFLKNHIIPS